MEKDEVLIGRFEGQPWKLWPYVKEKIGNDPCLICAKLYGEHSDEDFDRCMRKETPEPR